MCRCRFLTAFAVVLSVTSAVPASAAVYIGLIKDVQNDHLVLTVKNKDHQIHVADKTTVTLDGKPARLANLKAGFRATVNARRIGTRMTASSIAAQSVNAGVVAAADATFGGMIRALDAKKNTLTVYRPADKKSMTFTVGRDTKITLDGKIAKFAELKKGFSVDVAAKADSGRQVATAIVARSANLRD